MKKIPIMFILLLTYLCAFAQSKSVTGRITDVNDDPIPGVNVLVTGTTNGTISGADGDYSILVNENDSIQYSFIGMETQVIAVNGKNVINVLLREDVSQFGEVTVVGFGTQKKESVMASIETVKPAELKVPSSNLSTALAGRMSGLISYQRTGEPGEDDAAFFIRGVTSFSYAAGPLILIDGVESTNEDLSAMQPDDIESFSILKDAAATAVYGARGGNGIIMIKTKGGSEGKLQVNVRHEQSFSTATQRVDLADPIEYMELHNEATLSRDPLASRYYSLEKIDNTKRGVNPYVYPANDWYDMLFNDWVRNSRTNFSLSGGSPKVKYYLAGTFNEDNGNLKVADVNDFNNNIKIKNYILRSNVDLKLTKTTDAIIRFVGNFKDYTGPLEGGSAMYQMIMHTDPVAYPAYFEKHHSESERDHILFGNDPYVDYDNPYAELVKGYKEYDKTSIKTQVEIKQDFGFLLEGLTARALFATDRYSYFDAKRQYEPYYYYVQPGSYNIHDDTFTLIPKNPEEGTEWLDYQPSEQKTSTKNYYELSANYLRTFGGKHDVSAMLVATRSERREPGSNFISSMPHRNIGYAGRFTYGLSQKYFWEVNFGLNGSERFAEKNRWGFFPSAGIGYLISNEDWWQSSLGNVFTSFKLKATYGLSGTDAIGSEQDRFFYLSNIDLDASYRGYSWGEYGEVNSTGVAMIRYPNEKITWETTRKMNLGIEADLFDDFHVMADYYTEYRTDILMRRANVPSTMGLLATPVANVGEAKGHGVDISLDYNHSWASGLWLSMRGNFTYAVSEFEYYEDVNREETPWLDKTGQAIHQSWGYVAERLFVDEADVANSPQQLLGEYGPGDIKYRDINGDGKITFDDQVPIGHPTHPEIVYGFGFSAGYKGFDVSCFFQGLANESFFISASTIQPFVTGSYKIKDNVYRFGKNALLDVIADDHWSADNPDPYAFWPKLSDERNINNELRSTWWMRDGSFLRLKSLEIGYTVPYSVTQKVRLNNVRIYATGSNLLTFSKFKMWDPEMAANGFSYPVQRVFNVGIQIGL
ncbi:MAG: TonB-dependent receptor [Carboxylicivirga sp.]|jgi:TonB-linked SusC/RagA family outer membrane protein|nr:TonB-dependent receptor [Carboxylicivirga sp.]